METIRFATISESDLGYLFGKSEKVIGRWVNEGLPKNTDGSFILSRACRWIMNQHKEAEQRKVQLLKISQKDLITLTGKSRQTIFFWTEKHGLPRRVDGRFDLAAVIQWMPKYFDKISRQKHTKAARQIHNLSNIFKEKKSC